MFDFGPEEQSELLALARRTLELSNGAPQNIHYRPVHSSLEVPSAVFVSLYCGGKLRGCVGMLDASRPLYRNVIESTLSAAFRDTRFPPLELRELSDLSLEISVLSAFTVFCDPGEILIGRDGVQVLKGRLRALLLPQVAPRFGWDAVRLLQETCVKAGLPHNAWLEGARLERFTAQIFQE